ncbi:MAG: alpha-1,2-fucosyltransferase [Thermoleophilaceae bacterium]|nr:alpha-1,2-fucosyltransferase [Thermoleophilaceae bacterium]
MRLRRRTGWTTVRVISGLGNQLFQYATGRAVAERTGTRLRFDLSYIGHEADRPYALGDFHIRAEVVDGAPKDLKFMADHAAEDAYARAHFGATVLREADVADDPDVLDSARPGTFLAGYWQSPRYFADHEARIRRELRPRMTANLRAGRKQLAAVPESVAVHVRRGDYVSDAGSAATFGSLDLDYYHRAAALIREQRPAAEFFVFSDDPEWCRRSIDLPGPTHVVSGQNRPFEDLTLMGACHDVIVANSTFSWWGGWLADRPGALIVAPEVGFQIDRLNNRHFYPEHWLRV